MATKPHIVRRSYVYPDPNRLVSGWCVKYRDGMKRGITPRHNQL